MSTNVSLINKLSVQSASCPRLNQSQTPPDGANRVRHAKPKHLRKKNLKKISEECDTLLGRCPSMASFEKLSKSRLLAYTYVRTGRFLVDTPKGRASKYDTPTNLVHEAHSVRELLAIPELFKASTPTTTRYSTMRSPTHCSSLGSGSGNFKRKSNRKKDTVNTSTTLKLKASIKTTTNMNVNESQIHSAIDIN